VTARSRLRLSTATWGVRSANGEKCMVLIPEDSVIKIVSRIENRHGMIEVEWAGTVVLLFAQDVRERGESIEVLAAGSGN